MLVFCFNFNKMPNSYINIRTTLFKAIQTVWTMFRVRYDWLLPCVASLESCCWSPIHHRTIMMTNVPHTGRSAWHEFVIQNRKKWNVLGWKVQRQTFLNLQEQAYRRTGDYWILLILNSQNLSLYLTIGRSHQINKHQRWSVVFTKAQLLFQIFEWTKNGLSRA